MANFTFKRMPHSTGLARVAEAGEEYYNIKLKDIEIGMFGRRHFRDKIDIRFQILKDDIMEDGNPNCEWKWITLKYHPTSIQETKDFLIKFSKDIQDKFKLYIKED